MMRKLVGIAIISAFVFSSCSSFNKPQKPRLSMFVGVDISGSYMNTKYYDDSIRFLAHYLHSHLHGLGGMEVPASLFVGSIGGSRPDEPHTFHPIDVFQGKSPNQLIKKLKDMFPKNKQNRFTDFNAFFEQIALKIKTHKLVLRPITIILLSDGQPDFPRVKGKAAYKKIEVKPLESLSRNITIRLLYTSPSVGQNWQTRVKRKRVKVWTQDAPVMVTWKDPHIMVPGKSLAKQEKFFDWINRNVDFGVRAFRVD